jgi:hypothetical protein
VLGFLKPRGELVEISGRTVVFLSAKPYKMDQKLEVKLGVPEPSGQTINVAVRVLSCRSGPGDFFVVVGIAEGRREPPNLKGYNIRNYPRAPHRVTVKSEGLPGYRAVTRDLGRGGFGAELDGELPHDKLLNVHLEFDEPLGWTLDLKARVAWSIWKSQNRYDTGFSFVEEAQYALPLEQLGAWLDHWGKNELVPFKPPDKLPPRGPKELPNQLPISQQLSSGDPSSLSDAQRAAAPSPSMGDDDPTPLGLPTLVQPPPRPAALKLPQTIALERPSAFQLQPPIIASPSISSAETMLLSPRAPTSSPVDPPSGKSGPAASASAPAPPCDEDVGVRVRFEANLRGWAWEGADDAVVVVLEDIHGTDHWLEFPECRGLQARCRQREIRLVGMAIARESMMVAELTRDGEEKPLLHFRFYDDRQRTVLEIVAPECREQIR